MTAPSQVSAQKHTPFSRDPLLTSPQSHTQSITTYTCWLGVLHSLSAMTAYLCSNPK